jgi:cellulose synthase (UDP-forming)
MVPATSTSDPAPPREPTVPPAAPDRDWYFAPFEDRRPEPPVAYHAGREWLFQALAVCALVLGAWYLAWRWTSSVNWAAWYVGVPLIVAETLAFVSTVLFFVTTWRVRDTEMTPPPARLSEIQDVTQDDDRLLSIDVLFPTYDEDPELVRLSLRDAKAMRYPHAIEIKIHVLDDGRRDAMREVARQEGVGYLTRSSNIGSKAGNMRNALEHTGGDLLVICDADTRPFPAFLERTLGYFRDRRVAWVQTPQWFYDLDDGTRLPEWLAARLRLGAVGRLIGRAVERVIGPLQVGRDPFGNDPQMFYDVIQRRRNWANASFCCGAGSIYRREAVMEEALKSYADEIRVDVAAVTGDVADAELRAQLLESVGAEAARAHELTPYKFHVSEDIYTSIILHSDCERKWRSVFHPEPLSKMLSPQDLLTWTIQRFKYAGGTMDIAIHDNPLRRRGLSFWQKVMYGTTIYSYLAPLWVVPLLVMPIVYFFTGISAVTAFDTAFYGHIVPFLVVDRLAFMIGTWGVKSWRGEQFYLASFWTNLKALVHVLRGLPVKFRVTPKVKQAGNFAALVWPHIAILVATGVGIVVRATDIVQGGSPLGPFVVNLFWSLWNASSLAIMVTAAFR